MNKQLLLFFIIYSFIGWIIESTYRSLFEEKQLTNSGFLFGPFIPIYGFGAIFILLIYQYIDQLPFIFQILIFTLVATTLEYITSYFLEKNFSIRLWDYSHNFLNIQGRVCPLFSSFWAILSILQILVIHPFITKNITIIPTELQFSILSIFSIYICFDIFYSSRLYHRFITLMLSIRETSPKKISIELRLRMQSAHPLGELKNFLRPLKTFPYLREVFSESILKLPLLSKIPSLLELRNSIQTQIDTISGKKDGMDMSEFNNICSEIIQNPEFLKLKDIKHHDKDIYSHNLKVAWISYLTAKKFKLHVNEMVRGALLHDFFLYDWRKKGRGDEFLPHGFTHPFVSLKNSERVFGHLTSIERDIIIKHMWPLTIVPPKYPESFFVSFIDKMIASKEVANGISIKIRGKNE